MSHPPLILASASASRQALLKNAGLAFETRPARIDEAAIKAALLADEASPRDIADTLAEYKARKVSAAAPEALILGADQVLAHKRELFSKVETRDAARAQLLSLTGVTHHLYSAAVIYEGGEPIWRHVGVARMTMHRLSGDQTDRYLDLAWPEVQGSVGCYHAEHLGAQLFSRIEGDWFSVLGLPLLEVLSFLRLRGFLAP